MPGLVSYYGNRLSIESTDVPLDRELGGDERIVAPSLRGGALVRFEAAVLHPVIGRVVAIAAGRRFVPALGDICVDDAGWPAVSRIRTLSASPIGNDGAFYFDRLEPGAHRLRVRFDGEMFMCDVVVVPASASNASGTSIAGPIDVGTVDLSRAGDAYRGACVNRGCVPRAVRVLAILVALWLLDLVSRAMPPRSAEAQITIGSCTISATPVLFGNYNPLSSTPTTSTGLVTYQCTLGLLLDVRLSRGQSSTFLPRTMKKGAEVMNYNLYLDALHALVWGDGSAGTFTHTGAGVLFPVNVTVYGRIPAAQDVTVGTFTDTVVATIVF